MNKDVFIVAGARTAIGAFGGSLATFAPTELAATASTAAIERAGISPDQVNQTVFGNVIHTEPRDMYLSRVTALSVGVPDTSPALTLNRLCGSGLQAVASGADAIRLEHASVVLAGGAETMSRAGHLTSVTRFGAKMGDIKAVDMMVGALTDPFGNGHMGITAENVAEAYNISRERQDEFAAESQSRAQRAIEEGRFRDQIVDVSVSNRHGSSTFNIDEHPKLGTSLESLSSLRPAFRRDGSVTAGNASGINDGAAAVVLADGSAVDRHQLTPLARIVSYGLGGVAPEVMGMGPVPAVKQALQRSGLKVNDLAVVESNEAFAAQACAVNDTLGLDPELVNPNGGAIALGHPIGATGTIILIKLLYELKRRNARYGLATMCIGGGQGIAVIVENVSG